MFHLEYLPVRATVMNFRTLWELFLPLSPSAAMPVYRKPRFEH